jgi:hypothetical protein
MAQMLSPTLRYLSLQVQDSTIQSNMSLLFATWTMTKKQLQQQQMPQLQEIQESATTTTSSPVSHATSHKPPPKITIRPNGRNNNSSRLISFPDEQEEGEETKEPHGCHYHGSCQTREKSPREPSSGNKKR